MKTPKERYPDPPPPRGPTPEDLAALRRQRNIALGCGAGAAALGGYAVYNGDADGMKTGVALVLGIASIGMLMNNLATKARFPRQKQVQTGQIAMVQALRARSF